MPQHLASVFISATSRDLKSYRQTVRDVLLTSSIFPIAQDHFSPTALYRTLRALLHQKIARCDAVICLVGFAFGSAPSDNPDRSYTQIEYDVARELRKPVYLFLASEACQFDQPPDGGEREHQLQQRYRKALEASDYPWQEFSSPDEVRQKVAQLIPEVLRLAGSEPLAQEISTSRLPSTDRNLFGRERELKVLGDAWANPDTNVVSLVAWAGVGKSALVNCWLHGMAKDNYCGADRIYGWSFETQGTEQESSADPFIESALTWFGDETPTQGSPLDKGQRLARLVQGRRTLLVLDGLEPLQFPPGPQEGKLRDQSLVALLRELAARNPGLCVMSSNFRLTDLEDFERYSAALHVKLETLTPQAGADLLRAMGVRGEQAELEQAAKEFGGHSLALTLLGSYLSDICGGDVRRRGDVERLEEDERRGGHAWRVMASYEKSFGPGPEVDVLRLLGLFDRPADGELVAILREDPVILGLNDHLVALGERDWQRVLAKMRRTGLLAEANPDRRDALDTHPLVRQHFAGQLQQEYPNAWRKGHDRIYEHCKSAPQEKCNDLEGMEHLFIAVAHGCQAGRHSDAFSEVYYPRVICTNDRGEPRYFSTDNLFAFGADLAAVSGFFKRRWDLPVASISGSQQAFVLAAAGWNLRSLGRMKEAAQALKRCMEVNGDLQKWEQAVVAAAQLSQIHQDCGALSKALDYAKRTRAFAERGGWAFWHMASGVLEATALYQMGRCEEAEVVCREVEAAGISTDSGDAVDHSFIAFRWCDLQLSQVEAFVPIAAIPGDPGRITQVMQEIRAWSEHLIEKGIQEDRTNLASAVSNLIQGRAHLATVVLGCGEAVNVAQAEHFLSQAVEDQRLVGAQELYIACLLARAALRRVQGDPARARDDMRVAIAAAERGQMNRLQADCHLYLAQVLAELRDENAAREALDRARRMIQRMGYHRQNPQVALLERMLDVVRPRSV